MQLDTILNITTKYNLTGEELLLVYLTFIAQTENGNPEENRIYFQRWYEGGGKDRLRDLFNSLKEKGVIKKNYNPSAYDPDEIEFNQNFIKQYFKLTGELGKELWSKYPDEIYINNSRFSLKNIGKKFIDRDHFYFWYASTIGHNKTVHEKILEILDWAKSNNLINNSIIDFVASCQWESLEKIMGKNNLKAQGTTYDVYETL